MDCSGDVAARARLHRRNTAEQIGESALIRDDRVDAEQACVVQLVRLVIIIPTNLGANHHVGGRAIVQTDRQANDLVLGTHSRGIWILDNINMLQELTPDVVASPAHLFSLEPAEMIRYNQDGGHTGDMYFRGENPPAGATIDYFLREDHEEDVSITILDASGAEITQLEPITGAGLNRVVWDLHSANIGPPLANGRGNRGPAGPWVLPGSYMVRLVVAGQAYGKTIEVRDDPRINVTDAARLEWHNAVENLARTVGSFLATADSVMQVRRQLNELEECDEARNTNLIRNLEELEPLANELRSRLMRLYGQVSGWPAPFTADQRAQQRYFEDWIERLQPQVRAVLDAELEGC